MSHLSRQTGRAPWDETRWCAAKLCLCGAADPGKEFARPEQWIYFLWRPAFKAVPFRAPDAYGFTAEEPDAAVARDARDAPVYWLQDDECDWASWLQVPLACDDLEPWLYEVIRTALEEQRIVTAIRWRERFGSDRREFLRFL